MNNTASILPAHVPTSLVRDYPLLFGLTTDENPFETMIPRIHKEPEVFYSLHAYPGNGPAWIVRRTEDLKKVYFDTEHFSNAAAGPWPMLIGENWSTLPFEADPPMHALYRAVINPIFTPKAMAKLETRIRGYARSRCKWPRNTCSASRRAGLGSLHSFASSVCSENWCTSL